MTAAPLFPLSLLLLGGIGIGLAGKGVGTTRPAVLSWLVLLGALAACLRLWGVRVNAFGAYGSDLPSQFLSLLVLFGVAATLPLVRTTLLRGAADQGLAPKIYGSVLVAAAGMLLMVSTRNLGIMFLAIEVTWVGFAWFSVGHRGKNAIFDVTSGSSASAMCLGLVLFGLDTGHLDVASIEAVLLDRGAELGWIPELALWLFMLGVILKLVAIHVISCNSRGPSLALSATVQVAIVGALLRVTGWSLVLEDSWRLLLGSLAFVVLCAGSLMLVRSAIGPRGWSFAQLGQLGAILLGLTVGGEVGRSSVLFYLVAFIVMSVGAVGAAVALSDETHSALFSNWKDVGRRHPILAVAMGALLFSLAGVPPTIGFWGRWSLYLASAREGLLFLLAVALVNMLVGFTFYLKPLTEMWRDKTTTSPESSPVTIGVKLTILISVGVVVVLGLAPESLIALTQRVALELF